MFIRYLILTINSFLTLSIGIIVYRLDYRQDDCQRLHLSLGVVRDGLHKISRIEAMGQAQHNNVQKES